MPTNASIVTANSDRALSATDGLARDIEALDRSIDRVLAERDQLKATNAALLQALREVVGICFERDFGQCLYCGNSEGDAHDPDCTMNFVLDAIARAEGRS